MRNRQGERLGSESVETDTPYSGLMAAIRDAVEICLAISGWGNPHYSFIHRAMMMKHAALGVLEVNRLSDGVRNVTALVADIAYRAVRLNGGQLGVYQND